MLILKGKLSNDCKRQLIRQEMKSSDSTAHFLYLYAYYSNLQAYAPYRLQNERLIILKLEYTNTIYNNKEARNDKI